MKTKKIQIALLSPKGPLYRHKTGIFRKSLRAAPLTLTTLASLVPEDIDAEVKIYDEGVQDLPEIQADLIGMTVITGSAPRSYELSKIYRQKGIPVVLGGPHITLIPEEAQNYADSIVVGYAEETWPELLRDFVNNKLKPRYDMRPNFSFHDMRFIPFPKRELLKKGTYKTINTIEATRGCVHNCEFCVVPSAWGRRPFQKPVSHVVDDIRQLRAKTVLFFDLNLIADRAYAKELFTALIPLKIKWVGLSTTLLGKDNELLDLVAKSGCKGLLIGFESIQQESLKSFNKKFNDPSNYDELIYKLHSLGIAINGTFVFGNDGDTIHSFDAVKDFAITKGIDLPRFSIMTPFPGTPLHQRLDTERRILTNNWSLYDGQHVVFQPKNITATELLEGHEKVWKEVYSYKGIFSRLKNKYSMILPILVAANISYRYYANNLSKFYNCNVA
ncbi:MAG: B12-binding domain-containing radical SAM protein [Leptospiraceae bacterium]|nr:B12-binding domain-containing radical SAM protein [Leptospiraceae bacterium]MCP5493885.1 B12-binding domain-containing radical SAM protein [Leptospiraceae bacterium]